MRELRVFPRRTSYTPEGWLVAIGDPGLFRPPDIDLISVSCVFTWDVEECERLLNAWQGVYPYAMTRCGGPALDDMGGLFVPGRFVKQGVSISSRGCPELCPWCFVPRREGPIRMMDICEGHIIQDNNVLAFPRPQWESLCSMLGRQRRAARFVGGLQASRLKQWHVDALRGMRIEEVFLAADHAGAVGAVKRAVQMMGLPRRKVRCYVLIGYGDETVEQATIRLENVWEAGCLPFAQLYKDEQGRGRDASVWKKLARTWSRPAAMYTMNHADRRPEEPNSYLT